MLAPVCVEVVEERTAHGRKLWRGPDDRWRVEGFPGLACSLEDAETIAALAAECEPLARLNARIVELGGNPIPPRAARR
jgi:hypothetical protein